MIIPQCNARNIWCMDSYLSIDLNAKIDGPNTMYSNIASTRDIILSILIFSDETPISHLKLHRTYTKHKIYLCTKYYRRINYHNKCESECLFAKQQ